MTEMNFRNDLPTASTADDECSYGGSLFQKSRRPITLKFENVVYSIKTGGGGGRGRSLKRRANCHEAQKLILKGVSGIVLPGEMLAMLGPSGSGKTTLLSALGGRLAGTRGSITYNNRPFSNSLNRNIGFVTQDDVLYPHLTVTETLLYTALLRLPGSLTRQEKAAQAEAVMVQLGLTACRASIIGGELVRGVSGGERKRVSIGQEMLINPSLLFLDEPTSGLDSTTAQRIVSTLWELTKGGRTVVMTIHQPSSRLFYMFHKILLLSCGNSIYFGKGSHVIDYFSSIGYAMSVPMNPADFLLDLANGISCDETESSADIKEALVSAYNAKLREPVMEELGGGSNSMKEQDRDLKKERWSTSWWQQFQVLLERGLKERKHASFSGLKIGQVLIVSLLSGLLWFQSGGHLKDQIGLLFFTAGFWGFFSIFQAVFTFPQERMMLSKERSSGMYRLSSYFMARVVGDLPMELLLPTIHVTIIYWMGGLKPAASSYFICLSVVLLAVLVAQGLGLAIGAFVMDLKAATTLASVLMLTFMLVGGFYVQSVPAFVSWIKYLSPLFYTFKLLLASQYGENDTYQCAPLICKVADFPLIKVVGLDHRAVSVVALFLMLFLYRMLAYLALMRIGVHR